MATLKLIATQHCYVEGNADHGTGTAVPTTRSNGSKQQATMTRNVASVIAPQVQRKLITTKAGAP